ncbi:MAG: hypothetical protein ACRDCF_00565 [Mycoplasmoidaceae bacterium]
MKLFKNKKKDSTITEDKKTASETKIINLNDINIDDTEEDKIKYCESLTIDEIRYKLKNEDLDVEMKKTMEKCLKERTK